MFGMLNTYWALSTDSRLADDLGNGAYPCISFSSPRLINIAVVVLADDLAQLVYECAPDVTLGLYQGAVCSLICYNLKGAAEVRQAQSGRCPVQGFPLWIFQVLQERV